jgi:PhnB protein
MMPRDAQLDSRTFFTKLRRTGPQPNAALSVESRSFHIQRRSLMNKAKPVPKGFHTVTPYITAQHADKVIAFMQQAFGAEFDHEPMKRPDGSLMHATLRIGDSMVMIAQATEPAHAMPASLYLYLPNVDAAYQLAIKAGAASVMEPADQFYGDRCGGVKDSAGNQWFLATHIEDVQVAELKRRAAEFFKKQGKAA